MARWMWLPALFALAGCIDDAPDAGDDDALAGGTECDYELDDYAGGVPRLMVHWDIEGHDPRSPSGIDIQVTVYDEAVPVLQGTTSTDCILFDMEGLDADHVIAKQQSGECKWVGSASHAYGGDFEHVKVEMARTCT